MTESPKRKTREPDQPPLFDDLPLAWQEHWWGMPSFEMGDATPAYQITMNFRTFDDVKEFAARLGLTATTRTDSLWFPKEDMMEPGAWEWQ